MRISIVIYFALIMFSWCSLIFLDTYPSKAAASTNPRSKGLTTGRKDEKKEEQKQPGEAAGKTSQARKKAQKAAKARKERGFTKKQ